MKKEIIKVNLKKAVINFGMVFLFIFSLTCANYAVEKLSTPQNLKWSETTPGIVTWSAVKNADGYGQEILKDGVSIGAGGSDSTSCDISELIKQYGAGTYTVKVNAGSDVLLTSDAASISRTFGKLSTPSNLKWGETKPGILTWSAVKYADGYSQEILKDGKSIGAGGSKSTSCDIRELIKQYGAGTYTVKVKADSDVLPTSDAASISRTFGKLSTPSNLKWSETKPGILTWSAVKYADGYSQEILKDGKSIGAGGSKSTSCDIRELIKQYGAGAYTVKVKATSDILPSSSEVATIYTVKNTNTQANVNTNKNNNSATVISESKNTVKDSKVNKVTPAKKENEDSGYNLLIEELKDGYKYFEGYLENCEVQGYYEISLVKDNKKVDCDDEIEITLQVGKENSGRLATILHYKNNKVDTYSSTVAEDGTITFVCKNGLSPFAVLFKEEAQNISEEETIEGIVPSEETFEPIKINNSSTIFVILAIVIIGVVIIISIIYIDKKKIENKNN